ncbi:MAG: DUF423 domain-containing protein [Candidatus Dadabacteria bacterium]
MNKIFLVIAAVLGGLAVALGAFGAHGLKKIVPPETVATYQTGVQYQMYHALALLLLGILSERLSNGFITYSGVFFIAGIICFSGSLYLIVSLNAFNKIVPTAVGIITPVGGLFFIIGWLLLIIGVLNK